MYRPLRFQLLLWYMRTYRWLTRKPPRRPSVEEVMAMPEPELIAFLHKIGLKTVTTAGLANEEEPGAATIATRHT